MGGMVKIANSGTGDAVTSWIAGTTRWYSGLDQSDSSKWKLASTSGTPAFSIDTRMTVTQAGNVGVGTASPGEKLQVAGAVRVTSNALTNASGVGDFDYNSGYTRMISRGTSTSTPGGISFLESSSDGSVALTPMTIQC